MSSITNDCVKQNNTENSKSNSTIELEFSESAVQMFATQTYDNRTNSYSSFQQYYARKRCASIDSQKILNTEENNNKKQRNNNDHLSLLQSNEVQKQNKIILNRSVSIQNDTENNIDWFKDFMRQSLDTIRDTVVQACTTAISNQLINPLNSNLITRDININNHLTHGIESEHSLPSPLRNHSWQNHRLKFSSVIQDKNDDLESNQIGKKLRIHRRSRTSSYSVYRNILRTAVNDIQVPWSYEWSQYKPVIFTAEEVYINPGADPDLLKAPSTISLHFNTIDGAVDRRSVYHSYSLAKQNGLPLNPIGRTGLQGRGILLRWGPNIYHYIIICRWKRDNHGRILLHPSNGKKILEILLEIQTNNHKTTDFILTGGLHMLGSRFPPQLQDRLKRFIIHTG